MPGYNAPHEAIVQCGSDLGNRTGQVDKIKEQVANAEVPPLAWGLIGQFTHGTYLDMLEKFKSHLEQISDGVAKAGQSFTEAGKSYQDTDQRISADLEKIIGQLGKGV